jgi:hypothetical protein
MSAEWPAEVAALHEEIGTQAGIAAEACGDPQVAAACRDFAATIQEMLDGAGVRRLSSGPAPGSAGSNRR